MSSRNQYSRFPAPIYDMVLHIPVRTIRRSVSKDIKNGGTTKVIDLCCDTGNQIVYLRKSGIENSIGIDISDNMLHQTWRNGLKDTLENLNLMPAAMSPAATK